MNYRVDIFTFYWLYYIRKKTRGREREKERDNSDDRRGRKVESINDWHKNREDMFRDWREDPREENTIAFSLIVPTALIGRERCAFTASTPET